jgi:MATE family multidrug resistance protein
LISWNSRDPRFAKDSEESTAIWFFLDMAESYQTSPIRNKYREVLKVSMPLVVSMATTMVMEFTDRIFLANYSLDAIAAALPAGITVFLFLAFFLGTSQYVNVFIAQYTGSGTFQRVGAALWQGIYFSIIAGLIMAGLYFFAEPLFKLGGHSAEVQRLEVIYFRTLCLGSGIHIIGISLSCFYSGQGLTRPVMIINAIGTLMNIPLDYMMINGIWIFPEMGILGAGIATVASWTIPAVIFALMVFTAENNRNFKVFANWRFEKDLFFRLLRFGMPGAVQFSMDIFAFTFFIFMVGRIGTLELAVTNIVLSIDSMAFLPMMGFSLGTSTLVGQAIGRRTPGDAVAVVEATIHIVLAYLAILAILFLFTPKMLLDLFRPGDLSGESYAHMQYTGIILLRFVVAYLLFDALYMIYTGALKGAGDTGFIMWTVLVLSIFTMILPIYIGIVYFGAGLYFIWTCATLFLFFMSIVCYWRYRGGKWKTMRVIETETQLKDEELG